VRLFAGSVILTAAFLSPAPIVQAWNRHVLNVRATHAGKMLVYEYVWTPQERVRVVDAFAKNGRICLEFTTEGANPESIRWDHAFLDRDGVFQYGVDEDEFADVCSDTDKISVLPEVERVVQVEEETEDEQ
jgi:hypothetical protein